MPRKENPHDRRESIEIHRRRVHNARCKDGIARVRHGLPAPYSGERASGATPWVPYRQGQEEQP